MPFALGMLRGMIIPMKNASTSDGANLVLSTLELPRFDNDRCVDLSRWLIANESWTAKALMTPVGAFASRMGRAARSKGLPLANLSMMASGLASTFGNPAWLPASVAPAVKTGSLALASAFLAGFGAVCIARCAKIVVKDRLTYSDALASGHGHLGATSRLGRHLAIEAQARMPNIHRISLGLSSLAVHCAKKAGWEKASAALLEVEESCNRREDAFDAWRAGAASKANFMVNHGQRTRECYMHALRLLVAEHLGHFDLSKPSRGGFQERQDLLRLLGADFDARFPQRFPSNSKAGAKPLATISAFLFFQNFVQRAMADATLNGASASYAPEHGMPTLAAILGLLVLAARTRHGADLNLNMVNLGSGSLGAEFAPWQAAIEAQALERSMSSASTLSTPTPARRPHRI